MSSLDRDGLAEALRVLVHDYPRDIWAGHGNFDGLTRFWLDRHLGFRSLMGIVAKLSGCRIHIANPCG